jgi:DNA-binding CsgD family transcriptional regulator
VARSSIKRAVDECSVRNLRATLLAACVETNLACGSLDDARRGANELAEIAEELGAPMLRAMSDQQLGAVEQAIGEPDTALVRLRKAWAGWQSLDAPYEAARVRVLMAQAFRELGELDSARMELDAARISFQQLGAAADLLGIDKLVDPGASQSTTLTPRELEVIRLVATGATNREIAVDLVISEKTVARHVSNLYNKLDLSSRAAATAYAYEHKLV